MKKIIITLIVAILISAIPFVAEAGTKSWKCIEKNCNNPRYGNSVYCKDHNSGYQLSHVKCAYKNCNNYTSTGCGSYCAKHYKSGHFGKAGTGKAESGYYCARGGCNNIVGTYGAYCSKHKDEKGNTDLKSLKTNTTKTTKKDTVKSPEKNIASQSNRNTLKNAYAKYDSYDEGYEDIYDNEDYDEERYLIDSDYANGVDDAMEDLDW